MRIAVAGPATLGLLGSRFEGLPTGGYPFPMTALLCRQYLERGHQVNLVTTGQDITSVIDIADGGLRLTVVPARPRARDRALDFFAAERRNIAAALRDGKPDVVHAHWTYEFALAALNVSVPALVTVHDWGPAILRQNRHPYWGIRAAMQARALSKAPAVSAPSAYLQQRVERWYRKEVQVIPNGIDLSGYRDGPRGIEGRLSPRRRFGMLNVGFSRRKNAGTALRAWNLALPHLPGGSVLAVAGPDYEPGGHAHSWAQAHGLLDRVEFLGPIRPADIPAWFNAIDVFLHPSLEESFGLVLVEAMASRTPIIAGRSSGATGELLVDSPLLLDDVKDVQQMAERLIRASRPTVEDAAVVEAGARRAWRFDIGEVADRYLSTLRQVAAR